MLQLFALFILAKGYVHALPEEGEFNQRASSSHQQLLVRQEHNQEPEKTEQDEEEQHFDVNYKQKITRGKRPNHPGFKVKEFPSLYQAPENLDSVNLKESSIDSSENNPIKNKTAEKLSKKSDHSLNLFGNVQSMASMSHLPLHQQVKFHRNLPNPASAVH